jgi:hypothetical protein
MNFGIIVKFLETFLSDFFLSKLSKFLIKFIKGPFHLDLFTANFNIQKIICFYYFSLKVFLLSLIFYLHRLREDGQ